MTYYGLFALQHRGQESAGMVTAEGSNKPFNIHRGMGLVAQVFQEKDLQQLRVGTRLIGHVRYSTSGSSTLKMLNRWLSIARGASWPLRIMETW